MEATDRQIRRLRLRDRENIFTELNNIVEVYDQLEMNLSIWRKIENKVILSEKKNAKESKRYNVLVLMNHYPDL